MRIAILGCGYVANMYRLTLSMHPELELVGVYDLERSRAENMAYLTGTKAYPDFASLLSDNSVRLVLNLTNPSAHFETSRALLEAGKHVYTEKPVAMQVSEARALADLAKARGLQLSSAPCTLLNPVAQTLWKAAREDRIGRIRLAYAEMEDGMVPRMPYAKWVNEAGTSWPAVDEFETGCTVEHAGYVLSWLCAIFGPATKVTAFSDIILPEKLPDAHFRSAADFSVSCITFRSGAVARMTNGLYANHDHRLQLFGDEGVLVVEDPRNDRSPVTMQRYKTIRRKRFLSPVRKKLPLLGGSERIARYRGSQTRDFCRAIAEMAQAIEAGRPAYLGTDFSVHITELTLACHRGGDPEAAGQGGGTYEMKTDFPDIGPLPWAA